MTIPSQPEPTIICPKCKTKIKLTDSLAAPLIEATRLELQKKLENQMVEIVRREAAVKADQQRIRKAKAAIETQVESRLKAERERIAAEEGKKATLTIADRDHQIASMKTTIEELKRKSEQGSQQLQGEVFELELEALLRDKFPRDSIEPVPKGVCGGDVLHHVYGPSGQRCGTILWESKRTRNWSDSWLAKLRNDQREAKADVVLIVSPALPKGLESFDLIDGIWVTDFRCAVPVAVSVRHCLIEVASARLAGQGRQTKMEMVYRYLTGPGFRHRIEALVEQITEMQTDLDREKAALTRLWAKREAQIDAIIGSTASMFGDLQGIAGRSLQEIDGLNVAMVSGPGSQLEPAE